jgi:hypothetical protein
MPDFCNALNDDQLQLQGWVHDFAASVVRPAAHEWDERGGNPLAHHRGGGPYRALLPRFRGQHVRRPVWDLGANRGLTTG